MTRKVSIEIDGVAYRVLPDDETSQTDMVRVGYSISWNHRDSFG